MDVIEEFGDDVTLELDVDARRDLVGDIGHGNHEEKIEKVELGFWLG